MPIYEYECLKCGKRHEIMQKISAAPLTACPRCGGELRKLISNTSFVLKGTGWYATDYAASKKSGDGEGARKKEETKAADSGGEAKSESKPDPKPEGKKEEVAAK